MGRGLTVTAALLLCLSSLAAVPVKSTQTDTARPLQMQAEAPQSHGLPSNRSNPQPSKSLTCQQQCDLNYVRTHQMCLAAISGLSSADAPRTEDCDRAARAGIRQCQMSCDTKTLSDDEALTPLTQTGLAQD